MARSWRWYLDNLRNATSEARRQGYKGQRVHKMVGEANPRGFGRSSPLLNWESANDCNPTLLWHQPWVVILAELEFEAMTTDTERNATLTKLSPLVFATASFLADFAERRAGSGGSGGTFFDLGPPLTDAAEDQGPEVNAVNPTFEVTQVRMALTVALEWRARMGLGSEVSWSSVLAELAPAPLATIELRCRNQTVYNRHQGCLPSVFAESATGCQSRNNHPAMLGAYGVLPGERYGIDPPIMNTTMHAVFDLWEWASTWSWDWAMLSMTASRLGNIDMALNALLMDVNITQGPRKFGPVRSPGLRNINCFLPAGHNHPNTTGQLSAYMLSNGGVLLAVGAMAGREGSFPADWHVKTEGFHGYFAKTDDTDDDSASVVRSSDREQIARR